MGKDLLTIFVWLLMVVGLWVVTAITVGLLVWWSLGMFDSL